MDRRRMVTARSWRSGAPVFAMMAVACTFWSAVPSAGAYTIETVLTDGCHEDITSEALREARRRLELPAPVASRSSNDEAYIRDVQFRVASDQRDIGAVTMLVGVRDNDLKGHHGRDVTNLAAIHNDPQTQHEHCLRAPGHDTPSGTEQTVGAAREHIEFLVSNAVRNGIDCDTGFVDIDRRTPVDVYLSMKKNATVMVPIFHLYIGQALHVLQDSFTHTFRSADQEEIRVALNWVDLSSTELNERRDGPPHLSALDECTALDSLREEKLEAATDASTELLLVALDPAISCEEKDAAVRNILERWMSVEDGCSIDNRWCDAPELIYVNAEGCQCRVAPSGSRSTSAWLLLMVVLALAARRTSRTSHPGGFCALFVAASFCFASEASAQQPDDSPHIVEQPTGVVKAQREVSFAIRFAAAVAAVPRTLKTTPVEAADETETRPPLRRICVSGRQVSCACDNGTQGVQACASAGTHFRPCVCPTLVGADRTTVGGAPLRPHGDRVLGYFASAGASIDNPALGFAGGPLFYITSHWVTGLGFEWNPWASIDSGRATPGVATAYASLFRRYHINRKASVRLSVRMGASWLLFDLVDAPAGSVGPHFGVSWLGFEWELGRYRLTIDPTDVRLRAPFVFGVPMLYQQYRFTVGIQG